MFQHFKILEVYSFEDLLDQNYMDFIKKVIPPKEEMIKYMQDKTNDSYTNK